MKPPLKPGRIAGEFLLGGALGILCGFFPGYGMGCALEEGQDSRARGFAILFIALSAGGNSFGVYTIGKIGNETGSYSMTLLFSAIGTAISLCISDFFYDASFWICWVTLPTLGGIIGFNMTRRYETAPAQGTSLINFRDGQMSLAVPRIFLSPNPFDGRTLIKNIGLVQLDF